MNACRSCGQRLLAGDRFCPSCGMTTESGAVTARVSGAGKTDAPVLSPWTGIFDRLQTATLGEFSVIRELGRGGMAAVFLAHDVRLDRKVALKVMSPMLATDILMVDRFRREAKTGASLKHPNIGTVHRVLESDGLFFFVMDFVRGRPLDTIIRRNGVLSVPAVRALLHQIGSGLGYAHRRRIYHRDVKPANVLVSASDGTAVVTDFGIAKVAESPNQTQTGAVVGTPAYMAPEQILGREIGAEVDQYALGVMAYEMLTGTPPFVGTNFVVMHAHTEIQPRAIRESRPECPAELDEAIMRMLAKEPRDRWPSLPHALAAMGATFIGEDDPIREELIRLATPDDSEAARFATNTPATPTPRNSARWANVAAVTLYPPPSLVEVGDSFRVTASPRDASGAVVPDAPVIWSTTRASIVTVHGDGLVTALAAGSAEIIAASGPARGSMTLNVVPSRVASLQLSIPPGVLVAGDRIQLAARAIDKHQRPLSYAVRWGVADHMVAEVSPEGVLEARAPGLVEVFAESNGVRTGARVEVASPAVKAITLSVEPRSPVVGERILVNPTMLDADGQPLRGRAMSWSIDDRSLVKVITDGVYTAAAEGTLRVTVTSEGKTAVAEIVIGAATVAAVRISHAPQQLVVGSSFKLAGMAHDARGNALPDRRIAWSVADASLATVTATGTLTAISAGDLRVVASCEGRSASVPISIQPSSIGAVRISGVPQVVYVKMPFRLAAAITDSAGKQIQRTVEWRSSNVSAVSVSPTGQATASAVGHVRISAVVDGVEESIEFNVVEPPLPKVVVVPVSSQTAALTAPMEAMTAAEINADDESDLLPPELRPTDPIGTPLVPGDPAFDAAQRRLAPTPVLAPRIETQGSAPRTRRRVNRALTGGGALAVIVAIGAGLLARRDSLATGRIGITSAGAVPIATEARVQPGQPRQALVSFPADTLGVRGGVAAPPARTPDSTQKAELGQPTVAARNRFRINIAPQAPLRVGERATLHADVERVSGTRPIPRLRWTSNKPDIVRVDPTTGIATALAAGQATVRAEGGGARSDFFVSVIAAPFANRTGADPSAAGPAPGAAAPSSADDLRDRGADALRASVRRMTGALQTKDAALAGRLFGAGNDESAAELIRAMTDQFDFAVTPGAVNQPQVEDRSGTIDYHLTVSWVSAAGPTRTKRVTLRAEAERQGETWRVARHRIVDGWR